MALAEHPTIEIVIVPDPFEHAAWCDGFEVWHPACDPEQAADEFWDALLRACLVDAPTWVDERILHARYTGSFIQGWGDRAHKEHHHDQR